MVYMGTGLTGYGLHGYRSNWLWSTWVQVKLVVVYMGTGLTGCGLHRYSHASVLFYRSIQYRCLFLKQEIFCFV